MQFKLLEFNPRRHQRGAEAARVEIDGVDWLWMSKKDIQQNIKQFGEHAELSKALECYANPSEWFRLEDQHA